MPTTVIQFPTPQKKGNLKETLGFSSDPVQDWKLEEILKQSGFVTDQLEIAQFMDEVGFNMIVPADHMAILWPRRSGFHLVLVLSPWLSEVLRADPEEVVPWIKYNVDHLDYPDDESFMIRLTPSAADREAYIRNRSN